MPILSQLPTDQFQLPRTSAHQVFGCLYRTRTEPSRACLEPDQDYLAFGTNPHQTGQFPGFPPWSRQNAPSLAPAPSFPPARTFPRPRARPRARPLRVPGFPHRHASPRTSCANSRTTRTESAPRLPAPVPFRNDTFSSHPHANNRHASAFPRNVAAES